MITISHIFVFEVKDFTIFYPTNIIIATIIAIILYILLALLSYRVIQNIYTRFIWYMSIIISYIFIVLNILYAQPGVQPTSASYNFIQSYVHFDIEGTLANTYSGILLMCVSFFAYCIIIFSRPDKRFDLTYWVWLVIGTLFGVVAYDEYANPANLHGQTFALYGYIISGIIAVLCLVYILWQSEAEKRWRYIWLIGGLGAIGVSGVLLDNGLLFNISTRDVALLEETLEVLGVLTVFAITMEFASEKLPKIIWQITKPLIFLAIIGIGLLFIFSANIGNTIEYYTNDVNEDGTIFGDNLIELIAYDFPEQIYYPNDILIADLYFRANQRSPEDYSFSAHLLSIPNAQSVAQQDNENVGNGLTRTWIPDMIVKQSVAITIPSDINVPAAYSLSIRLWSSDAGFIENESFEEWQNLTYGLAIESTTHPLLEDDVLLLQDILILPEDAPQRLTESSLRFENGIELIEDVDNQTITQNDTITLAFQWLATNKIEGNWQQIIHLQNQDTLEVFVFDRPPFDGRIPTSTWLADFIANDTIQITIPDNMLSGTYDLLTGLYDPNTVARLGMGDYQDNIATIATIMIEP